MNDPKTRDRWRDRDGHTWEVVSFKRYADGYWRIEIRRGTTTITVRDNCDLLAQGTLRLYFKAKS